MRRDFDLIREILLQVEENNDPTDCIIPEINGYSEEEVTYHINLLWQAGLVDALNMSTGGILSFCAKSLTWEGHEFLDAARNDNAWRKTKKFLGEKMAAVTFDLMKTTLLKFLKQELGI
jgi:hypothetical protein